jgi:paraquat-inducible protein A
MASRAVCNVIFIGRWSMIDVFVVSLLTALIQIQALASISAGPGAVAFGAVVVLTMLASLSFDPRIIWDNYGLGYQKTNSQQQDSQDQVSDSQFTAILPHSNDRKG